MSRCLGYVGSKLLAGIVEGALENQRILTLSVPKIGRVEDQIRVVRSLHVQR